MSVPIPQPVFEMPDNLAAVEPTMSPELAAILSQFMGGSAGLKGAMKALGMYQYYRQPNGYITVSPAFGTDMLRYMMEGWTPLTRYGRFKLNQHVHEHKFEWLFQKSGQLEVPIAQLIEEGFHTRETKVPGCGLWMGKPESYEFQSARMRENIIPNLSHKHDAQCYEEGWVVKFPQFSQEMPESFPCQFCSDVGTTEKALERHVSIAHKDRVAAYSTANAIASALKGFTQLPTQAKAKIQAASPFVCGSCGESYSTPGALIACVQSCIGGGTEPTVVDDSEDKDE